MGNFISTQNKEGIRYQDWVDTIYSIFDKFECSLDNNDLEIEIMENLAGHYLTIQHNKMLGDTETFKSFNEQLINMIRGMFRPDGLIVSMNTEMISYEPKHKHNGQYLAAVLYGFPLYYHNFTHETLNKLEEKCKQEIKDKASKAKENIEKLLSE